MKTKINHDLFTREALDKQYKCIHPWETGLSYIYMQVWGWGKIYLLHQAELGRSLKGLHQPGKWMDGYLVSGEAVS